MQMLRRGLVPLTSGGLRWSPRHPNTTLGPSHLQNTRVEITGGNRPCLATGLWIHTTLQNTDNQQMDPKLHHGLFSWPPLDGFRAGPETQPADVGIDVIEADAKTALLNMIQHAKDTDEDEPFCVFDMGSVVQRYKLWRRAFPAIKPFYAIKAYDDPVVIKLLAELGAGFDCASKSEIQMAHMVGVKSEDIIFANTMKLPSHLSHAAVTGVSLMTFDSHDELLKVKRLHPKARLLVRMCPVVENKDQCLMSKVFGCSINDVRGLLQTANTLQLNVIGVAFHIGPLHERHAEIYIKQMEVARSVFDIAAEIGFKMTILNIGGGFSGKQEAEETLLQTCTPINEYITEKFPGVTVMSEPGRFFVDYSLSMAACVIGRQSKEGVKQEDQFVISASAFGIPSGSILPFFNKQIYQPQLAIRQSASTERFKYKLRGPTCAPIDNIHCDNLPQLQVGDWLIFEYLGAYTVVLTPTFNGFLKPPIRRVMQRDIWESLLQNVQ